MTGELGTAALLTVAAITPGPNNLIIMAAARRGGWLVALRSIVGVVLGSLALLLVWLLGLRTVGHGAAILFDFCTVGGAFYLAWVGLRLAWRPETDPAQVGDSLTPARLIFIQAVNPKAWVLTATVAAGATGAGWRGVGLTAAMMIAITASCLFLWAVGGQTFARLLSSQKARRRADQIFGAALVATALMVAVPVMIAGGHLH